MTTPRTLGPNSPLRQLLGKSTTRRKARAALMALVPTEHDDQCALVELLVGPCTKGERIPGAGLTGRWPELGLLYAVPNGGHRHPATAAKLKREGVLASVCDLVLPVARGPFHGLYVEIKRRKGSKTTEGQKRFQAALKAQGYAVFTCKGVEQGLFLFQRYLDLVPHDEWRDIVECHIDGAQRHRVQGAAFIEKEMLELSGPRAPTVSP